MTEGKRKIRIHVPAEMAITLTEQKRKLKIQYLKKQIQ